MIIGTVYSVTIPMQMPMTVTMGKFCFLIISLLNVNSYGIVCIYLIWNSGMICCTAISNKVFTNHDIDTWTFHFEKQIIVNFSSKFFSWKVFAYVAPSGIGKLTFYLWLWLSSTKQFRKSKSRLESKWL